jgi:glutamate-1-semialdehyde 2,1-aminomutase
LAQVLTDGLTTAAALHGQQVLIQGVGPVFHLGFTSLSKVRNYRDTLSYDSTRYDEFCNRMREKGIRLISRGLWYLSVAHSHEDIDLCVQAARDSFGEMKSAESSYSVELPR